MSVLKRQNRTPEIAEMTLENMATFASSAKDRFPGELATKPSDPCFTIRPIPEATY
jgi:hypothetical protein